MDRRPSEDKSNTHAAVVGEVHQEQEEPSTMEENKTINQEADDGARTNAERRIERHRIERPRAERHRHGGEEECNHGMMNPETARASSSPATTSNTRTTKKKKKQQAVSTNIGTQRSNAESHGRHHHRHHKQEHHQGEEAKQEEAASNGMVHPDAARRSAATASNTGTKKKKKQQAKSTHSNTQRSHGASRGESHHRHHEERHQGTKDSLEASSYGMLHPDAAHTKKSKRHHEISSNRGTQSPHGYQNKNHQDEKTKELETVSSDLVLPDTTRGSVATATNTSTYPIQVPRKIKKRHSGPHHHVQHGEGPHRYKKENHQVQGAKEELESVSSELVLADTTHTSVATAANTSSDAYPIEVTKKKKKHHTGPHHVQHHREGQEQHHHHREDQDRASNSSMMSVGAARPTTATGDIAIGENVMEQHESVTLMQAAEVEDGAPHSDHQPHYDGTVVQDVPNTSTQSSQANTDVGAFAVHGEETTRREADTSTTVSGLESSTVDNLSIQIQPPQNDENHSEVLLEAELVRPTEDQDPMQQLMQWIQTQQHQQLNIPLAQAEIAPATQQVVDHETNNEMPLPAAAEDPSNGVHSKVTRTCMKNRRVAVGLLLILLVAVVVALAIPLANSDSSSLNNGNSTDVNANSNPSPPSFSPASAAPSISPTVEPESNVTTSLPTIGVTNHSPTDSLSPSSSTTTPTSSPNPGATSSPTMQEPSIAPSANSASTSVTSHPTTRNNSTGTNTTSLATRYPSSSPSAAPSAAPSPRATPLSPTTPPTAADTESPVPTSSPTSAAIPTSSPTVATTENPTQLPTEPPTRPPTNVPTSPPTPAPTPAPTSSGLLPNGPWKPLGQELGGEAQADYFGASVALSRDARVLAVGATQWSTGRPGYVSVFELDESTGSWVAKGQELFGEANNDDFGWSVALNGDGTILAVGADLNDGGGAWAGHVRVFQQDTSTNRWVQLGSDIDGEAAWDYFGYSVSLSKAGDILAAGAPDSGDNNRGSFRTFQYNHDKDSWELLGNELVGQAFGDQFGWSVSLSSSGEILAVGAINNDSGGNNAGQVSMYQYNSASSEWDPMGSPINGVVDRGRFGSSVSLDDSGMVVAVGAPGNDEVLVYAYDGATLTWIQHGQTLYGQAHSNFGYSVSLNGNGSVVAVGSSGQVAIFQYNTNTMEWDAVGKPLNGKAVRDYFGNAVSLSEDGTVVAVGAYKRDFNGFEDAGSATVYTLN